MDLVPDIAGRTVTADALLTQTAISACLHGRGAHFMFVAKRNQKNLFSNYTMPCGGPGLQHHPGKIVEIVGKFERPGETCKRLCVQEFPVWFQGTG